MDVSNIAVIKPPWTIVPFEWVRSGLISNFLIAESFFLSRDPFIWSTTDLAPALSALRADAIVTKLEGLAIGVLTADCVPIILYDEINKIIGCIHAGWKGAISGIIENTLNKFKEINENNKIIAVVGPCIGYESYEVSLDFYDNFLKNSKKNTKFFSKKDKKKFLFNLREYIKDKLSNCGVDNIDNINIDTFKDSDNFFSYRRSHKLKEADYGRCISTICLFKN